MKIHKLIIEGAQFVGKTTIANNLARRYLSGNPFLFKLSGPSSGHYDTNFKHYMGDLLLDYSNLFRHITDNSVICDRFHISEQVYGEIYRDYHHKPEILEALESILHELDFKVIFLEMDDGLIEERLKLKQNEFNTTKDTLPSVSQQKEIKSIYQKVMGKTRLDVINIDVTGKTVAETAVQIIAML